MKETIHTVKRKKITIYISLLLKINEKKKRRKENKSLNICHLCEVWGTKIPKGSNRVATWFQRPVDVLQE